MHTQTERETLNAKRLNCLRRVFQAGVTPNQQDAEGWTPAMQAVLIGDLESLAIMRHHGLNLECVTPLGTLMTLAVQREDVSAIAWLLQAGASLKTKDMEGNTPMDYAKQTSPWVIDMLKRKNAK